MTRDPHDLGEVHLRELLARWHSWRREWSHERGFARCAMWADSGQDDELEQLQLEAIERAFNAMAADQRVAVAHIARAEFLGVDVFRSPRLMMMPDREGFTQKALAALQRELKKEGVI